MAVAPRPMCAAPACRFRAVVGSSRCEAHRAEFQRAVVRPSEVGRRERESPSARGYGYAWERISAAVRRSSPWCDGCGTADDLTVDHVVPMSAGGGNERSNLRVLCRRCHGAKPRWRA